MGRAKPFPSRARTYARTRGQHGSSMKLLDVGAVAGWIAATISARFAFSASDDPCGLFQADSVEGDGQQKKQNPVSTGHAPGSWTGNYSSL